MHYLRAFFFLLPSTPPLPMTPPKYNTKNQIGCQSRWYLKVSASSLPTVNHIKKHICSKPHRISENETLDAHPKLQFWWFVDAICIAIFDQISWTIKSLNLQLIYCENFFFTISGLPFSHHKLIENNVFSNPLLGHHSFYFIWRRAVCASLKHCRWSWRYRQNGRGTWRGRGGTSQKISIRYTIYVIRYTKY